MRNTDSSFFRRHRRYGRRTVSRFGRGGGASYRGRSSGLGGFFVIMLVVFGLPLIVLSPLAIIAFPLFVLGGVLFLLIGSVGS